MDKKLWSYERYEEFLFERRRLLAEAANAFLDSLVSGAVPETEMPAAAAGVPGGVAGEDEERMLAQLNEQMVRLGLPAGEVMYELADPQTGQPIAVLVTVHGFTSVQAPN